jgi:hypothetical protein
VAADPERVVTKQPESAADRRLSAQEIGATLAALRAAGAHQLDGPRFHFIEALLRRASGYRGLVAESLLTRTQTALLEYQQQFLVARQQAAQSLDSLCGLFPDAAVSLQQLIAEGKLRQFQRLVDTLQQRSKRPSLALLPAQLQQRDDSEVHGAEATALDLLLVRQEQQALAAIIPAGSEVTMPAGDGLRELRAARYFRKSQARHNAARLLAEAVESGPQNSGPLNPELLAIRTLEALRGLSPEYVQHMVSYINTVLRLKSTALQSVAGLAGGKRASARHRPRS